MAKITRKKVNSGKVKLIHICVLSMLAIAFIATIFRPDFGGLSKGKDPASQITPGISPGASQTPDTTPTDVPSTSPTPSATPTPTPVEPLITHTNDDVADLIKNYYNAKLNIAKSKAELSSLTPYVSNIEAVNLAELKKDYSLILSLENFTVYTLKGTSGLKYIAFVSRDMELVTLEGVTTPEFSLLTLVEIKDEDGKTSLVVNTDSLTDEQNDFINEVLTRKNFLNLYSSELNKTFEAIKSSEELAKVWYNARFSSSYDKFDDFKTWLETASFEEFIKLINPKEDDSEESFPEDPDAPSVTPAATN